MPKILKAGIVKLRWPFDRTFKCRRCGCEFQLTEGDFAAGWTKSDDQRDGLGVSGLCPQHGCGERLYFND